MGFCSETIDGRGRRDVKRAVVLVSPCEIGWLFGHFDCAQMVALRIPHPDTFWPRHIQISIVVNFDSVRNAFVRSSALHAKDSAVA